ncbi:MAG: hypothetical protein AB7V32_09900, partial [Candidatus Berkiella sp.]
MRNKLVGTYDETVTYINETYRQLIHFETMLSKHKSAGYSLNLNNICSSAAFIYALGLPKVIKNELRRGEAIRPSWTIGVLLSKIPFFNRFSTYQLFSGWDKELNNSRKIISLKYRKIAKFILDDFEKLMLNSIQAKSFNFQEGLINSLEKFMELYGEKSDLEKFKIISDPITILQKFDFLMPANESNDFFVINDDAIITFKNFAHKYWPAKQQNAIEAILNIINKSDIPADESEDANLKQAIDCLLKGDDKEKAFKALMNTIAMNFLFKAGDDGNNNVYSFLQRHAKEAAANFRAKRQLDIEDKFIFINKILSDGINQEIDLSKQEIYEIQNLKLRYSLYDLYINDIMEDDKVNQTNKMALLHRAAQRYIRSYKGDNCEYADLILSLCMPQKMTLVNDFLKKRLTYILDIQTKDNALVVLEDYQFLSKLSKDPAIVDTMVQVIDSHYDGSNIDDIELILAFGHDKVTAKYIAKRIAYFINKHDYDSLNEESSLYQDYVDNQFLQEYIQKLLLDHYDSLILNRNWDALESSKLSCFVEKIGTIQSKETYRLLRINRLLKRNDSEATKDYLSEVASFIGSLEKNLITLPRAKALLEKILSEQLIMLQEEQRWEGHTQYFLDFFLTSDPKGMVFDIKMAWLKDYFANPAKFSNANSLERSFLEAKYHFQNKEVPSEDIDLETFYSKANLRNVKKIIMDVLDNVEILQDDDHLNLMRRYLKDKAFTLDPQWPLYVKKIEIYQNVVKIAHLTSKGAYTQVMKYIEHLISEIKGLKALNSSMPDPQRTALIAYNKRMLALLGSHIKIHFQNKIVSKELLEKLNSKEFQKYAKLTHQERKLISQLVKQSGLSNSIKANVDELDQNAQHIYDVTTGFVCALHFKSLHLIEPSEDNVRLFRQCLSLDTKKYISQRIEVICGFLTEDDPLYQALCAFVRVLNFDEDANLLDVIDLSILNRYRVSQRNYPQMANEVALKIIQILNERKPLSECSVFNELKGSYQSAFINEMSPKSMALLTISLKAKIEWIVITQDTVSNEHI